DVCSSDLRFGASARLQAEQRAAVVDEVELDVAAAPVQLELALAFAEGRRPAPFDDRQVGVEERIADAAREREAALEAAVVEIVEEQAADAARFVAMLEEEILVAPPLPVRIEVVAERRDRIARDRMPMAHVLVDRVVRGQ